MFEPHQPPHARPNGRPSGAETSQKRALVSKRVPLQGNAFLGASSSPETAPPMTALEGIHPMSAPIASPARPTAPPPVSTDFWSLAPLKNAPIRPPARRLAPKREMRKFHLHNNLWLPTVPWRSHRTNAPLFLFHSYIPPCARSVARPDAPPPTPRIGIGPQAPRGLNRVSTAPGTRLPPPVLGRRRLTTAQTHL